MNRPHRPGCAFLVDRNMDLVVGWVVAVGEQLSVGWAFRKKHSLTTMYKSGAKNN